MTILSPASVLPILKSSWPEHPECCCYQPGLPIESRCGPDAAHRNRHSHPPKPDGRRKQNQQHPCRSSGRLQVKHRLQSTAQVFRTLQAEARGSRVVGGHAADRVACLDAFDGCINQTIGSARIERKPQRQRHDGQRKQFLVHGFSGDRMTGHQYEAGGRWCIIGQEGERASMQHSNPSPIDDTL